MGKSKTYTKICIIFIFIIFLFSLCFGGNKVTAQSNKTIINVAFPIQERMSEIDDDGVYSGYSYEYLTKLSEFTNYQFKNIVPEGRSADEQIINGLNNVKSGKYTLMGGILKNSKTLLEYEFCENNYGLASTVIATSKENWEINEDNFMNHKDLKIAIRRTATTRNAELDKYLEINGYTNFIKVECDSDEEQLEKLNNDEVDAILSVNLSLPAGARIIASFSGRPFYFISNVNNKKVLEDLDKAIEYLNAVDPSFQTRLYNKYFVNINENFKLSKKEETYINEKKVVEALIASNAAPFQYKDKDGEYKGISIKLLEDYSNKTGLAFNFTFLPEDKDLKDFIASEKYDVIIGVPSEPKFAEKYDLALSLPFLELGVSIFENKNSSRKVSKQRILALPKGAEILKNVEFDDVLYFKNVEECLEAVSDGKADFTYANNYSIDYYMQKKNYSDVFKAPITTAKKLMCFGIIKPADIELISILNKCINSTDEKEMHSFIMQIMTASSDATLQSFIQRNIIVFSVILIVLILFGFLIMQLFMKNKVVKRKNSELLKANESKTVFLSRMSHEMRTPLNGIMGMNEIAKQNVKDEKVLTECTDKIEISSMHLLSLINDVLDMTKISEGKMILHEDDVNIAELVKTIETIYTPLAMENDVTLSSYVDKSIDTDFICDELRLKQVLINLISNGIKYNRPKGSVSLQVILVETDNKIATLKFSVTDTGIGIEEKNQAKIFNIFEREENDKTLKTVGTGLGLTISNEILSMYNSQIYLNSRVGEGSIFCFELKLKMSKLTTKNYEPRDIIKTCNLKGKRFLVVEDNEINAKIVKMIIEKYKGEVEVAENGKIAVDYYEKNDDNYYNCILMDVRMPVMDGYEATRLIRSSKKTTSQTIKIYALSANAFKEDMEKSMESGMNAHISKPIVKEELLTLLNDVK